MKQIVFFLLFSWRENQGPEYSWWILWQSFCWKYVIIL